MVYGAQAAEAGRGSQWAGAWNNPFCLQYYEAWEESEILFIQMELCQQGSLKDHAMKHDIGENELWELLASIVLGLNHIHSQNLLHLDIKPGNILMGDDDIVKIGDFGIAQRFRRVSDAGNGGSSAVMDDFEDGDPVYMAPELLLESQECVLACAFLPAFSLLSVCLRACVRVLSSLDGSALPVLLQLV